MMQLTKNKNLRGSVGKRRKCYQCGFYGHIASNCKSKKTTLAAEMMILDLAMSKVGLLEYSKERVIQYYRSGKVYRDYTQIGMEKYIQLNSKRLEEKETIETKYKEKYLNLEKQYNRLRNRVSNNEECLYNVKETAECSVMAALRSVNNTYNPKIQQLENQLALMQQELKTYRLKEDLSSSSTTMESSQLKIKLSEINNKICQVTQVQFESKNIISDYVQIKNIIQDLEERKKELSDEIIGLLNTKAHILTPKTKEEEKEENKNWFSSWFSKETPKEEEEVIQAPQQEKKKQSWFSNFLSCGTPEENIESEPIYTQKQPPLYDKLEYNKWKQSQKSSQQIEKEKESKKIQADSERGFFEKKGFKKYQ